MLIIMIIILWLGLTQGNCFSYWDWNMWKLYHSHPQFSTLKHLLEYAVFKQKGTSLECSLSKNGLPSPNFGEEAKTDTYYLQELYKTSSYNESSAMIMCCPCSSSGCKGPYFQDQSKYGVLGLNPLNYKHRIAKYSQLPLCDRRLMDVSKICVTELRSIIREDLMIVQKFIKYLKNCWPETERTYPSFLLP